MYSLTHLTPQKAPNDLSDDELTKANDIVGQLIVSCFRYLDYLPPLEIQKTWNKDFSPSSENEWIRLLLLNVFDGCAMSFQGCESQALSTANGQPATICGQPCLQYISGSMYEGISCASPKEYSDTDVMNVLQNFLVIEVLDDGNDKDLDLDLGELHVKEDKTAAETGENLEETKRGTTRCDSLDQKICKNYEKMPKTSEQSENTGEEILKIALQCQKGIPSRVPSDENQKEIEKENNSNIGNFQYPLNIQDKDKTSESSEIKKVKIGKGSYPGYAKIINSSEASDLLTIAESLNVGPVIRSTDIENLLAHEFQFDNAIAVECKHWPGEGMEWGTRERKFGWPSSDVILQCRKIPCSIVSKSHTLNPNDPSEWRFSFSRQEGILFRSLPILKRMVYVISKVLLKQAVLKEESLTSYHLKTSFLWFCECTKHEQFSKNELEANICDFLQFLIKQLERHNIPNYFIEQANMISHLSVEKIEDVKIQIEYFLFHLLEAISTVSTAKQYPFNMGYTAKDLQIFPSKGASCLQKIHCNFLFAIIGYLCSLYLPNSHLVWMYCQYIPFLVQGICSIDQHKMATDISNSSLETLAHSSSLVFKVYGNEWIKLVTLYCSLIDMKGEPEIKSASHLLLGSSFAVQNDHLSTSFCVADTINLIAIELGVSSTEVCCLTLKEWVLENQTGNQVFMLTLKKLMTTLRSVKTNRECNHLLACLVVTVNVFELSKEDVEVGMAASLRLYHSLEDIRVISTLCDLINIVELNSVLKHLVYLTVLLLEEEEEKHTNSLEKTEIKGGETKKDTHFSSASHKGRNVGEFHEAKKALEAIQAVMRSRVLKTLVDDFRFLLAAVVLQKLTSETPKWKIVHAFLKLMKSTSLSTKSSDLQEIQTDISNLVQTDTFDFDSAFQLLVFYACKSIASSGLEFASSVLDELVQPHFNLGVLSAAGTELTASENLNASISTLELWLNRSTGAPIAQNPILRVKIYGKLGYLYHIKAMETKEKGLKARLMAKSAVMFGTAIKEKVSDTTVLVDYVLFQWERQSHADVAFYLHRICSCNDIMSISVYFKHSMQLMNNMFEITKELEIKGQIKVSSIVFAHFIAISYSLGNAESNTGVDDGSIGQDEYLEHLEEMQRCIDVLDFIYRQMGHKDSDCSDEVDVLVDTNLLLGFAANRLGEYKLALSAFKNALTMDPNNVTAKEKINELSVP